MRWIIPALLALMAGFVALAVVPDIGKISSDPTYTSGGYSLRLTQEPCMVDEWRDWLEENGIPPALASVITQEGRPTITGCWAADASGDIMELNPTTPPDAIPIERGWFK